MIGQRTRAREIALQALFCGDVLSPATAAEAVATVLEHAEAASDVKSFARQLVEGVRGRRAELDRLIAGALQNWDVDRLAAIDRNVLRLAVYEFVAEPGIPALVTINEAIELGKRFSTAQSGAFVNGILDRIRKDLGLPADPAPDADATDGGHPGDAPAAPGRAAR